MQILHIWVMNDTIDLKTIIRTIPDFPKPGILFYDISTLLGDARGFKYAIDSLIEIVKPLKPDMLVAIEARGFLLAAPLAYHLGVGFAMVRKKGKLPGKTIAHKYDLEYGQDEIFIQADAFEPSDKLVVVDDLLATGGTLNAAIELSQKLGGNVLMALTIIELVGLNGRGKISVPFQSLIQCEI